MSVSYVLSLHEITPYSPILPSIQAAMTQKSNAEFKADVKMCDNEAIPVIVTLREDWHDNGEVQVCTVASGVKEMVLMKDLVDILKKM